MSTKLLTVTRCSACPFFEDDPIKKIGGVLAAAFLTDSQRGICNLLPSGEFVTGADVPLGLPPGPERDAQEPRLVKLRSRRVVHDKRTIPDHCPLHQSDFTITTSPSN